jgi:hypothetical protein
LIGAVDAEIEVGLVDLADGLLARVRIFTSEAEALEAAGLSE